MNIGEAAKRSGLPTKTIRYYESVGLLKPRRLANGFRDYRDRELQTLQFLALARSLGFSVDECRGLLGLFSQRRRAAPSPQEADPFLASVQQKRKDLRRIELVLKNFVEESQSGTKPSMTGI